MTKEKVRPIIQALADWAVDDALASHDAGVTFRPDRKRLGRKGYKRLLDMDDPAKVKPKARTKKSKT